MSDETARSLTALRRSHDHLAQLVGPLDAQGVRAPSYDSDWSIAQVLSHLGSQAEIFTLLLDAGLTGADAPGPESFPPIWDAWNARSPEAQVADSLAANEAFLARLESLDVAQSDAFRLAAFGMDLDLAMLLRMRLSEQAVHTWDVDVALDPGAVVAPYAVELLIDGLGVMVARAGKPTEGSITLKVSTTGPERTLALVTDGVVLEPWSERDAAGELRLSAEELLRLVYGRLDASHAATVQLDAPGVTLDDVRAIFPGV
jgi:uncharacterized protein (TIGR03083 family)